MNTCPTCGGDGTVNYPQPRFNENTGETILVDIPEQCPTCDGEGTVNEKVRRETIREINADADYEEQKLREK